MAAFFRPDVKVLTLSAPGALAEKIYWVIGYFVIFPYFYWLPKTREN